jgi:diguanylate cyclase (GGDEF)-like protein
MTHEDVTRQYAAESRLAHLALHDSLTGLPNRARLRDRLAQELASLRRSGRSAALLLLDLDGFKAVNDTLGHGAGDALLQKVAARLRAQVRETDVAARLGGDEFAVLQTGDGQPTAATALAERLVAELSLPFEVDGQMVRIGASIGVALAPQDGDEPDQLLRHADLALYRAKADGRGTHRFFEVGMDQRMRTRRTLELELRRGLAAGEFTLHYQPTIDLRSRRISGFEALLRWRHPERGLVSPGDFVPLAEETGLIVPLGEFALRRACADATGWPPHLKVAVNLSPLQFGGAGPLAAVERALAESGLPPHRLEVEITETAMLADTELVIGTLRRLKALGVRIAMDDFGTGYSSLNYLRKFPFDRVKIDRSFISALDDPTGGAIVRAVTALCQTLGMETTAEGVESVEQLMALTGGGCDEAQGFLFSRPRPVEELPGLLRQIDEARHAA